MRNLLLGGVSGGDKGKARNERKGSLLLQVREPSLHELRLEDEYDVQRVLADGCYSRVLLCAHRRTASRVVLKAVCERLTAARDFCREFHYSYHLSPHPAILDSYAVTFRAAGCLVFAQEHAPLGDLARHVRRGGLPGDAARDVALQLASALAFVHSKDLVHRDVRLENVLVFVADFSKVKLSDFGATRRRGALVDKPSGGRLAFSPPEICETLRNERYACEPSGDSWQLGVLLFVCLAGGPPWRMADAERDAQYAAFRRYQRRRTAAAPRALRRCTPRALRLLRRLLEHDADKRAPVTEVLKYASEPWLVEPRSTASASPDRKPSLADGSHSRENHKNKLNEPISSYGLAMSLDKITTSRRVREWVLSCDTNPDDVS